MSHRSKRPGGKEDSISEIRAQKGFKKAAWSRIPNVTEGLLEVVLPTKGRPGSLGLQEGLMEWTLVGSVEWVWRLVGTPKKKKGSLSLSFAHPRTKSTGAPIVCSRCTCSGPTPTGLIRLRVKPDHLFVNKFPDWLHLWHRKHYHVWTQRPQALKWKFIFGWAKWLLSIAIPGKIMGS